jgi:Holliday junction resolvase
MAWLKSQGFRPWKNVGSAYSEAGLCDVMAMRSGELVCIETKSPGKEATALQLRFLREMQDAGAKLAMVAYSLDDVKSAFQLAGIR